MKFVKIILVLLVLGVAVFLFRQCRQPNYKNLPPTAQGDWVAFGDSLTSGIGASDGKDYPSILAERLGVDIHNLGVAGETTQDALNRLDKALALQPRVVLLCLGGNDGLRSLPREQMFANLGTMIDRFHEAGSFVVLIGVRSASIRDKNGSGFESLADEKQTFFVSDILDGVMGSPALMSDYIHPNDAGYQAIAERLEAELSPILPQLKN